ncbi:hypothetical protein IFM89_022172, partial [Coptis chinensis]
FNQTLVRDSWCHMFAERAAPLGRTVLKLLFEKVLSRTNVADGMSKKSRACLCLPTEYAKTDFPIFPQGANSVTIKCLDENRKLWAFGYTTSRSSYYCSYS